MADTYVVQITRGQGFKAYGMVFRRGVAVTLNDFMPEPQAADAYATLLRRGNFADPRKDYYHIHPGQLSKYNAKNAEVVVIRDMGLGDVVIVSAVVRALQAKYPKVRFRYAVKRQYLGVFRAFDVPMVALEDLNGRHTTIDLTGYGERAHDAWTADRLDVYARYTGVYPLSNTLGEPRPVLGVAPADMDAARAILLKRGYDEQRKAVGLCLRDSGVNGPIMSHPFVSRPWNRTMALNRQREFAQLVRERGWQVVLLDHEVMDDREWMWRGNGIIDVTGQLDLGQLGAVLSLCDVAVGPDTGQYHYAHAVGTPVVVYFGKIDPALRVKNYDKCTVLWRPQRATCPCGHSERCPDVACVAAVSPQDLMSGVDRWIDHKRGALPARSYIRGVACEDRIQSVGLVPAMGRL